MTAPAPATRVRKCAGTGAGGIDFHLPPDLEAKEPPEERGLARDGVRLLVAHRSSGRLEHRRFTDLPSVLSPGDVLVVNTSATLPAALTGALPSGERAVVHLSGRLPSNLWLVELRHSPVPDARDRGDGASTPWLDAPAGTTVSLPEGGRVHVLSAAGASRPPGAGVPQVPGAGVRLWVARLELPSPLLAYLAEHGAPIRYGYVGRDRPISVYQTVFADEPGSAEMPSAARPFSAELVARLASRGIVFAPFVLHAGVSSPEAHERPPTEWYRVPKETADLVNAGRATGHRVIAVGTTAVRALETVADAGGRVRAGEGWTDVVITADRGVKSVDGLLTGWHEPRASHLDMLEAVAGRALLRESYTAALAGRYLWHEFGDSHLILP